jgi:hypothetical protein
MPHGFFTVEQWKPSQAGSRGQWKLIFSLHSYQTLTKALGRLEKRGQPGLYRITQMQRCIWAEVENGKVCFHGSHVSSLESLKSLTRLYQTEGGRRPVEKARRDRSRSKGRTH